MKKTEPKPRVRQIDEAKFKELSAGGKYIEGRPLPMRVGGVYLVEVLPTATQRSGDAK